MRRNSSPIPENNARARFRAIAAVTVCLCASAYPATKHVWSADSAGLASVDSNWTPAGPLAPGDTVQLDGTSIFNMTWDVNVAVGAWDQTSAYTGWVIFRNRYSANDSVKISGNCAINGGNWTHQDNTTAQTYRLKVYVGGNFTLAAGDTIFADTLGYSPGYGPGNGGTDNTTMGGGGYGGKGGGGLSAGCPTCPNVSKTYGSVTAPYHLGSGGNSYWDDGWASPGSGAIWMNIAGSATINGTITASGDSTYNSGGAGSGGSIYLRCGTITGTTGRIRANGGVDFETDAGNGSGGRVAVILTGSGADFTNFSKDSVQAFSGNHCCDGSLSAAPGTVYLQTYAQGANGGELIIKDKMKGQEDPGIYNTRITTLNDSANVNVTIGSLTLKDTSLFEIGAGDTLNIAGAGTTLSVPVTCTLTVKGALNLGGTAFTVDGKFDAAASGSRVMYTGQSGNGAVAVPAVTYCDLGFKKSGAVFNLPDGDVAVTDSVTVLAGTLAQSAGALSFGALRVCSGATFSNHSTGDIIVGVGGVSNAGTIDFDGNGGGCGGNDDISITSSASGVQRPWSGAGTFTLYDISVADQAPNSVIIAYSGTDAGNNGSNWRFRGCTADYSTWTHNRKIVINTTPQGANITTGVRDFPLLVVLNKSNFKFAEAQNGGADLRFTNSGGTDLSYQIERWNAAAESSEIWVRVDTIAPNSATQYVNMYWGKNTAGASDGPSVFLTSNGFRGVWHCNDTTDATINAMNGTRTSGVADTAGDIAGAQNFNGATGYIDVADAAPLNVDDTFTVSLWARFTDDPSVNGSSRIISRKLDWGDANGFSINRANQTKDSLEILGSSSARYGVKAITDWSLRNWEHIAVVFQGANASVYGGGALKGGGPGTITKVVNNSNVLTFGQQAGHNETSWKGQLDEIRLDKAVRSADWIKLCYETQRAGSMQSQFVVEIARPGSDFKAGAGTMLGVEVHDQSGALIASDTSTMITFTPTKHGAITGVTEGTGDGSYGVAAGAEIVTVRNGRATVLLNDWQADTFAVVITNSAGLPNAAPDTIVVTAATTPVVTVTPADTTVPEGRRITIIAHVVGSRPLTYRWTVAGSAMVRGADSALEIAAVTAADSGRYICVVTNASGTGADTAAVRVAGAPKARFTFAPQNPLAGAPMSFADSSTGSIAQWRWSFGDGIDTAYDAHMASISHVYSDTGGYTCKLTVIGAIASMRDSIAAAIYVSKVGENPLRLAARVLSSTRIELTFKGIKDIPTGPLISPRADKLYCWFGRSGLSRIDTLRSRKFQEYSIATMLAAMGNDTAFTDIVTVPAPILLSDSIYGFWASPLWNGLRASPFSRYNAVGVRMAPVNNLTVNGQYLGNSGTAANPVLDAGKLDTVRVLLGNAGSLDTAGVQSVVIAYRLGSAAPFDLDTIAALDVLAAGTEYIAGKRNPLFMEDTTDLEISAWLIGRNLQISEASADTFMVGWPYPANPCSLRVEGRLTANQAPLVWNNPGSVDSVRILYGVNPVPLGQPDEWKFLSLGPSRAGDTMMTVIGLQPQTHYYFAIQARKNLHWSNVTTRSRADVVTPEYGTGDSIENAAAIDSLWFAQTTNTLHIRWHARPLALITRNMGVRISADSALARAKPPTVFDGCVVSPLSTPSGEMTIDMANTIEFNATLYVGLWLQNTRGPWSQPTDSSFGSFMTPDFTWQRIAYFGKNDTVRAFNGTVLMRKDSLYQVPMIVDTVTRYYPPDTIEGLLPLSIGFSLKKENIQSFYVGLRYDSLPSTIDFRDLAVYRDSAGRVLVEYGSSVDTASRTVWACIPEQDSRSGGPFFVMADTLRPRIFIVSDTAAPVSDGEGITDRFTVRDNIGNVRWRLLYSRDGRPFRPSSPAGYLCGGCDPADTATVNIDGWFVTEDNGLLSFLIISDGVHADTVNLSRQARRENADAITTLRNCWTPVFATTELDNPGASGVLRSLVPSDRPWVYMPARFRMFQWLVTDENRSDTVPRKWVEYSDRDSASFAFLPGRARWLKTIEPASFDFGSGRSVSLKKPVEVPLNPGEWTDIAVPYHFDVRAADIIHATGIAEDSLEIYKWVLDTVPDKVWGGEYATFVTNPLYISKAPETQINDPAIPLTWQPLVAYSVYCWPRRSITLKIPPISAELSAYQPPAGGFAKKQDGSGWSAKVIARTEAGRSLNTVYCGYTAGPGAISYHPQPPGFLPLKAGIYDARQQRTYGHGFAHQLENGGLTFAVAFMNTGDKVDTIRYHVDPGSGFPAGFTARMYDPVTGAFSAMGRDTSLVLGASERVLRILTIGTESFVSSAAYRVRNGSFALVGCSMNPASNGVLIRYQVPLIGMSTVRFRLYDMSGRQIWRQSIDRRLHAGVNTMAWNGISQSGRRVSTGMYILIMQAYDRNGRIAGSSKAAFAFVR